MPETVRKEMLDHMDRSIEVLKSNLVKIQTGRANPAMIEDVHVNYYGAMTPLNQMATIAAPGQEVITTYPGGGWASATGTSFAAPWVAGAVALMADKKGDGAQGTLRSFDVFLALSGSDPISGANASGIVHGRLDVKSALDNLGEGWGGSQF